MKIWINILYGSTPLSVASYRGDVGITQILIHNGAQVDSDALNAAIQAGNIEVIRLLLRNGGDVNKPDSSGTTPLRQAIHYLANICFFNHNEINPIFEFAFAPFL